MKCTWCGKRWWFGLRDRLGWVCSPCVKAGNLTHAQPALKIELRIRTANDVLFHMDADKIGLFLSWSGANETWTDLLGRDFFQVVAQPRIYVEARIRKEK